MIEIETPLKVKRSTIRLNWCRKRWVCIMVFCCIFTLPIIVLFRYPLALNSIKQCAAIVLPTDYCPVSLADKRALKEMRKLTLGLRYSERSTPYLHNKISFFSNNLPDPPDLNAFTFVMRFHPYNQTANGYRAILDPWGTPYFLDGINYLFHCAGPDKVFEFQSAENKNDDILVSFKPEFFLTQVAISENDKLISFVFNKPLKEMDKKSKSLISIGKDSAINNSQYVPIERTVITNTQDEGFLSIYLKLPLPKGQVSVGFPIFYAKNDTKLFLDHMAIMDIRFKYIRGPQGDNFRKNNIEQLPVENLISYGLIKEVANAITCQEAMERRSKLQSKRWFLLDE